MSCNRCASGRFCFFYRFRYGNKAEVWQKLIDDKKLPYIATVRNLRNLVLAGISSDHVAAVCKYISNSRAVAGSRMFPFRFYTAFDALNDLEELSKKEVQPPKSSIKAEKQAARAAGRGRGVGRGRGGRGGRGSRGKGVVAGKVEKKEVDLDVIRFNKLMQKKHTMNKDSIAPFRTALEKAVKRSTVANIPPLQGVTVVLCSCGSEMNAEFSAARGLMKKGTSAKEAAFLMALMCHSAAEVGTLLMYGERKGVKATPDAAASLLSNVDRLLQKFPTKFGYSSISGSLINDQSGFLRRALADSEWIDNLVLIHARSDESEDMAALQGWIARYRASVNSRMVFASVNVGAKAHESTSTAAAAAAGAGESPRRHPVLDLHMSGFSEQIFTCLAGVGNGGQLEAVETVDRRHKVDPPTSRREMFRPPSCPLEELEDPAAAAQQWRRVKIFISSTFVDMHGERDLINRFVIPELKRRGRAIKVDLSVVDLRWGVTSSSGEDGESFLKPSGGAGFSQLLSCLREAQSSHLFVGLLGERYGWKPPIGPSDLELGKNRELKERLAGLDGDSLGKVSITEMEIATSVLSRREMKERSLFLFRNSEKLAAQLPSHLRDKFFTESGEDCERMVSLKETIRRSGHEVYDGYPATFAGVFREVPVTGNLEAMGKRLLQSLWAKLQNISAHDAAKSQKPPSVNPLLDQDAFAKHVVKANYVPRPKQVESIGLAVKAAINDERAGSLVEVQGKAGAGISTLLCKVYNELKGVGRAVLVPYFTSAVADANARSTLRYMAQQLATIAGVTREDTEGVGTKALAAKVASLFAVAAHAINVNVDGGKKKRKKRETAALIVIVDGLEGLRGASSLMEWIPQRLPSNSAVVISTRPGGTWAKYFVGRKADSTTVRIGNLDLVARKEMCRHWLSKAGKRLEESAFNNQLNLMIGKRDATNPGYLKRLTEEIVNFGIYEELELKLREAGGTFAELQAQILDRLEDEVGEALVQDILGVLSLSTANGYGMTEPYLQTALTFASRVRQNSSPELTRLLSSSESNPILLARTLECEVPRLTALQLSMALNALEPFLQPTKGSLMEGLLLLREGEGLNAITERYLAKTGVGLGEDSIHKILAAVFARVHERDGARTDPIALHALPLHLAKAGKAKALEECVCRLSYVAACAQNGVVRELISHLQGQHFPSAAKGIRQRFAMSSKAEDFAQFVSLLNENLTKNPSMTHQLALNEPANSEVRLAAELDLKDVVTREALALPPLMIEWCNRPSRNATLAVRRNMQSEITVSCVEDSTAIRPDKLLIAHGLSDGSIAVNLAFNDAPLFSLIGHSSPIRALCFISGGSGGVTFLASGSDDGSLCIWDLESRIRQSCVQAHSRRLSGLAASADGLTLVSVGWDCLIKVWQGRGVMREVSSIAQNQRPLNCVAYHPDKDYIIVGGWEGRLKIYDLNTHERKAILRGHRQSIQSVEISRDARRIASCGIDGTCKVFDSQIGSEVTGFEVGQAAFDLAVVRERGDNEESESRVLVGCRDGQIQAWSMHSGANSLFDFEAGGEKGAGCKITSLKLFSYGRVDKFLALGFENGNVQVAKCGDSMPFSAREFLPKGTVERKVGSSPIEEMWCAAPSVYADDDSDRLMASLFDGDPVASGDVGREAGNIVEVIARGGDGACHFIWQTEFTSDLKDTRLNTGERGAIGAFRLPDGTWLVASGANFLFFVQKDLVQGKTLSDVVNPLWDQEAGYRPITSMAQSESDPEHFATCDDRGEIAIWTHKRQPHAFDLLERVASYQIEDPNAFCPTSLSFTAVTSGQTEAAARVKKEWVAATSDTSAELRFYAVRGLKSDDDSSPNMEVDGEMQLELHAKLQQKSHRGPINSLSAVDQHLVCVHVCGGVSVWSNKGIELRWIPSARGGPCSADVVVYSNPSEEDACLLLVAAADGDSVGAFNLFQSVCLGSTSGHSEAVNSLTLVRDGAVCCSAGKDAAFRMWDVRAATEAADREHFSPIVAVRTVHDGKISASLSRDGFLVIGNIHGVTRGQRLGHGEGRPTLMAAEMASDSRLIIATVSNRDALRLFVVPVTTNHKELLVSAARCVLVKEFKDELAAVTMSRQSAGGNGSLRIELLALKPGAFRPTPTTTECGTTQYWTLKIDVASLLTADESGLDSSTEPFVENESPAEFNEIRKCGLRSARGAGWTTSFISWGDGLRASGDTNGEISVFDGAGSGQSAVVAAHDGGVRVLMRAAASAAAGGTGLLFSGGGDGAVRAWRASAGEGGRGLRMEQVGEFVGNGMPIVSIGQVHRSSFGNSMRFLVGDSAGAVYILKGHSLCDIE